MNPRASSRHFPRNRPTEPVRASIVSLRAERPGEFGLGFARCQAPSDNSTSDPFQDRRPAESFSAGRSERPAIPRSSSQPRSVLQYQRNPCRRRPPSAGGRFVLHWPCPKLDECKFGCLLRCVLELRSFRLSQRSRQWVVWTFIPPARACRTGSLAVQAEPGTSGRTRRNRLMPRHPRRPGAARETPAVGSPNPARSGPARPVSLSDD